MPTYEYACSSCDTTHEVQQKMSDPTLTVCPVCGKPTLRKLFSGVGIHFKGSGFYRTDSRDAKSSSAAPSKDKPGTSDKSSGSSSSDKSSGGSTSDKSSGSSSSGQSSGSSSSDKSSGSSSSSSSGSSGSGSSAAS